MKGHLSIPISLWLLPASFQKDACVASQATRCHSGSSGRILVSLDTQVVASGYIPELTSLCTRKSVLHRIFRSAALWMQQSVKVQLGCLRMFFMWALNNLTALSGKRSTWCAGILTNLFTLHY